MIERVFVAVWDDLGLESVFDLTDYLDNNNLLTMIEGKQGSRNPLSYWKLRARYNSHRNYEIYAFGVEDGITCDDVAEMFDVKDDMALEMSKNIIRSKGQEIKW